MGIVLSEGRAVTTIPSPVVQMREAVSLVQRQIEDLAWVNLSRDDAYRTLDDEKNERERVITRARLAAKRNPLARQAVNLLQHYVLGQGISIKAENKQVVARLLDEFLEHTENEAVLTCHQSQKEFLERLFVDGDVFIVLFPDRENGMVRLGWLEAMFVEDIIPVKGNRKIPAWYKVRSPSQTFNFRSGQWEGTDAGKFVYYRHWRNDAEPPPGMGKSLQDGLVYQVSIDKAGLFGRSGMATAIDWLVAHREFMEDRATLNRAAASVAWIKKRVGPASDIAAEVAKLQSSLVTDPRRYETNPTRAAGSTVVQNQGSALEWAETDTGGAAADYDERKFRMMSGSGMGGVPNHYFGDEAQANLATATAMELPLLKTYEDWQQVLRQTLLDIIGFFLEVCHEAGRLGERDDTARYAEHLTTAQAVMDQPDQDTGQPRARTVQTREALTLPYTPPPKPGGITLMPRPDKAPAEEPEEVDETTAVSYYVDIDYPPIVEKELDKYMGALEKFAAMLPTGEVLEAKKLIVELGLQVFGVNDVAKMMARLFPPDMVAVLTPAVPANVDPATGKPLPPDALPEREPPVRESIAAIRRRRLLSIVREVGEAEAQEAIG